MIENVLKRLQDHVGSVSCAEPEDSSGLQLAELERRICFSVVPLAGDLIPVVEDLGGIVESLTETEPVEDGGDQGNESLLGDIVGSIGDLLGGEADPPIEDSNDELIPAIPPELTNEIPDSEDSEVPTEDGLTNSNDNGESDTVESSNEDDSNEDERDDATIYVQPPKPAFSQSSQVFNRYSDDDNGFYFTYESGLSNASVAVAELAISVENPVEENAMNSLMIPVSPKTPLVNLTGVSSGDIVPMGMVVQSFREHQVFAGKVSSPCLAISMVSVCWAIKRGVSGFLLGSSPAWKPLDTDALSELLDGDRESLTDVLEKD